MSDTIHTQAGEAWRNRIAGYGEEDPDQLLANPRNWRIHPAFQQQALQDALEEIGWLSEVIVNRRTSEEWPVPERGVETVLDGHLRVRLALRDGQQRIPVKYVDLSPGEELLALATFDPLAALAVPDPGTLKELIAKVQTEGEALDRLLGDLAAQVKGKDSLPLDHGGSDDGEKVTQYICPKCGFKFHVDG